MHIEVQPDKCTGCRLCQQICAIHHFKEINPKRSAINIEAKFPVPGGFIPHVCDQCGDCEEACFTGAIEKKGKIYVIDPDECTFCGQCQEVCPNDAINLNVELEAPIKCDMCLKCTKICSTGALTAVK